MKRLSLLVLYFSLTGCMAAKESQSTVPTSPKEASQYTKEKYLSVKEQLPFKNKLDFINARRGFIAAPENLTIYSDIESDPPVPVWDLTEYQKFISLDKEAPYTVNPSLWRNAQLGMQYGLFKVIDNIYQVRGYDLSNITFVRGKSGWIVFDPLISPETAREALKLINKEVEDLPVAAIVYSHSHIDHYGGAAGLFENGEAPDGVDIIAPEGFTEHAVSENVIAGNAMGRRAIYMYGALLPRNSKSGVNGGLGMTTSTGVASLLLPTKVVTENEYSFPVDGIDMVFQLTPGTEAPAEMNTWIPDWKALWMAENTTNTMHNVLTLRGAEVRDPLKWASFLDETIEKWGSQVKVKFQSHHWPLWGNKRIVPYFQKQRDIYKFIHDQSVRLMNHGYTGEEISEMIKLPESLEKNWSTRGYYGTLRHNSRAVYQRYMGWYTGHPSDLNNLPPAAAAVKYIEFMGGETTAIDNARKSFNDGEYRWVAEVMKHAVFSSSKKLETLVNERAREVEIKRAKKILKKSKELLADALEQLGYQAESGPWRSVYLQGAYELRNGVPASGGTQTATPDTIAAMSPEMLFDYLSVRLSAEKAEGANHVINVNFIDDPATGIGGEGVYTLTIKNSVLNYTNTPEMIEENPEVTLSLTKSTLVDIQTDVENNLILAIENGSVVIEDNNGDDQDDNGLSTIKNVAQMFDAFDFWFNIITP